MCGFFSVFQETDTVNLETARRALDALTHRGPDQSADWTDDGVFLGHRRLSVIDLATGDQPMFDPTGRYGLVFNGEIYNYRELRSELRELGAQFRTQSDSEVILAGYRHWGADVVDRLHGMFAFVVWDREDRAVFGARDRIGIKPLCWAIRNGSLVTASTLEPFLTIDQFRVLDPVAIRDLMAYGYVPAPRTILDRVNELEPGCRLQWTFGQTTPRIERYWSTPLPRHDASPPDEEEVEALLDHAVQRQMVSDVPLGAFLSGGIDSSLLVALMARHSHGPVRTFSVSFRGHPVDETGIAQTVAECFATDHTVVEAEDVGADELLTVLGQLDEPFCNPAYIPTVALSAATRKHVTVALSGDGADELFGGYARYLLGARRGFPWPVRGLADRVLRTLPTRPRGLGRFYARLLTKPDLVRYVCSNYGDFPVFPKDLRQLLVDGFHDAARIPQFFQPWETRAGQLADTWNIDTLMRADMHWYLSENGLVKTDRASMLASLEVRVPFLDELIVERVLPLPAERKLLPGQFKMLLQPLSRRLLPRAVWDRPKQGFRVPFEHHMAHDWRPAVEAALDWGETNFRVFDYRYLRRLHAHSVDGDTVGHELWNPFVLLSWSMARSMTI